MGVAEVKPEDIFCPKSIAIIGASSDEQKEESGWTGTLLNFGFEGPLYPVNPKASKILGLRAYPSLKDIDGEIDYAILNLKPPLVPRALKDCLAKGVKVVHIFSSGFAEVGSEEGKRIQEEIHSMTDRANIRLIGPNCMGVHCPEGRISFANLPRKDGPAALISQTGAGAARTIFYGSSRGIYFGKAVSYGNAVDMDSPDFLEMLADDTKTKFIALYIEGVKDGRRLFSATQKCIIQGKPIVILKAGLTEAGRGAVTSHTGAIAGSEKGWEAFFAQTGAISVHTLEEIVDQLVALQNVHRPGGRRVGIIGRGGGPGVIAAEICEEMNLRVPPFSAAVRNELERITTAAGGSMIRNPVEVGVGRAGAQQGYIEAFKILAESQEVDLILTHLNPEAFVLYGGVPEWLDHSIDALLGVFNTLPKPIALVLPSGETQESRKIVEQAWTRCSEAGLAVFRSYESAAIALNKLIEYYEFRDRVSYFKN
jgi:acyl-CoA synthetase (NDP forming)